MLRVAEYQAFTDTGRARRHNEDSFYARTPVFAVADGMGGAQAGEVASHAAVETVAAGLPEDAGTPEQQLAEVVRRANANIFALSREDEAKAGMGTTITAVHVGEHQIAVAHVGDSRAYRLRDGALERLTEDHSLVEEMRRRGQLTAEEADEHPQRSIITRALGPEPDVLVDTASWPARAGDVYLLCSDGLTSMIHEAEVEQVLRDAGSLREAGRGLIDAANRAGGRDNITVVLLRLEDVDPEGAFAAANAATEPSTEPFVVPAAPGATAVETRTATEPVARRRAPRPPRSVEERTERRARRRRRRTVVVLLLVLVIVPVVMGSFIASQAVYFIGASPDGFVTMYRGLPYDGPGGFDLYTVNYVSGVPVDEVPAGRRARLLDHTLRSHDDAADLVRELERGRLAAG